MDTSDVIALGAFALSAVGAVIALWQAGIASRARADAQQARDDAAGHERAALTASQKAADAQTSAARALEEANEIAKEALPASPWELTRSGSKIEVRNASRRRLYDVEGGEFPPERSDLQPFTDNLPWQIMSPNESIFFLYSKSMASPRTTTLLITWRDDKDGEQQEWGFSLS